MRRRCLEAWELMKLGWAGSGTLTDAGPENAGDYDVDEHGR